MSTEPIATTANGDLVEHTRDGVIIAMHPADGRCPNCPPVPPKVRWHRVEVRSTSPDGETLDRAVEGDDAWVAASLRALADQLDPPKPPRPNMRGGDLTTDAAARLRKPGTVSSPSAVTTVMQGQMPDTSAVSRAVAAERERRRGGPDPLSFR